MTTSSKKPIEYPLYVAGKASKTGQWLDVHHKYTGEVYARVAVADAKFRRASVVAT